MSLPKILSKQRTGLLVRLITNGVLQAGAAIATTWLIKVTFDVALTPPIETREPLALFAAGLIMAAAATAWLRMAERIQAERLGQNYVHELRLTLFQHLTELAPRTLQRRSRGGVMLRFVGDLTALRQWVSLGVARLMVASVTAVGTLLALTFIDLYLALTVTAALLTGAAACLLLGKPLQGTAREARRRRSYLAANIADKLAAMPVVQVFDQGHREQQRINRQSCRLKEAMEKRARVIGGLRAITEGTAGLAGAAVLLLGAQQVLAGQTTPGTVVAAMSVVGLLVPALRDLGRVYEYWHGAAVSRERIEGFLRMPTELVDTQHAVSLMPGPGRIQFANVHVEGSVQGVSAQVESGQVVALMGPNGAGKSTLLALVSRMLNPQEGQILIDGQNIAEVSLASLRRSVGMVSPDLPLVRGTLEKNLRYRWPDAPQEEIHRVTALCGVDEIISALPQGIKTRIQEDGRNLSLGQRQRIKLARALLGNPKILLLDEVDANLDPRMNGLLQRVFSAYDGTVLMVTHRLETAANADVIWHIADGCLLEMGCPQTLLASGGPTARLFHGKLALAS